MEFQEELLKMLEWPNTPDRERLERAIELYSYTSEHAPGLIALATQGEEQAQQIEQAVEDLTPLTLIMEDATWQKWCLKTVNRELKQDDPPDQAVDTLFRIAISGEGDEATGLAIMAWTPKDGINQDPAMIHFGRMPRHPDWTGTCPQLSHTTGLDAILIRSLDQPERLAATISIPHIYAPKPTSPAAPSEEEQRLIDILTWHGTKEFTRFTERTGFETLPNHGT